MIEVMVKMDLMLYLFVFLCACSASGQSGSGAVCVGDGVASEHWPGQKLHLALLRKRPTAWDISNRRLGFRTTVSFNFPLPLLVCLLSWFASYLALRVRSINLTAKLLAKWSGVDVTKWEVTSHLWCFGL